MFQSIVLTTIAQTIQSFTFEISINSFVCCYDNQIKRYSSVKVGNNTRTERYHLNDMFRTAKIYLSAHGYVPNIQRYFVYNISEKIFFQ